jgi:hypothetical protein
MAADQRVRFLAGLIAGGDGNASGRRLCEVAADLTAMSGAGIMLVAGERPEGSFCTNDGVSEVIEELQYTLGEGPCVDAHSLGTAVIEPDLASPVLSRWQAFTPPAVKAGVRAVFGFPVRVGAARLGALNLYRDQPGPLSRTQHADAVLMADVAAQAILAMQADAPPGELAAELEAGVNFQFVVHQAVGMVSVQLGVKVPEALVRLRAYAFATNQLTAAVATAVVSRELRFGGRGHG